MKKFPLENVHKLRKELTRHPVYASVTTMDELAIFMEHHIYSVWDFMSLVKYLQNEVAPAKAPWVPSENPDIQRFINDIVLEEESDEGLPAADGSTTYTSHFKLYTRAMDEVKSGSSTKVNTFVEKVISSGLDEAMRVSDIPRPCREFMETTFDYIKSDKPHVVAAAFALGREHIIPEMFQALLNRMQISREDAQMFHYYLDRHIELDGDHHGPLSMKLLDIMCEGDERKIAEAEQAACEAIEARIKFWDGVLLAMENRKIHTA